MAFPFSSLPVWPRPRVVVRPFDATDIPAIVKIEQDAGGEKWTEEDFVFWLEGHREDCIGMVCEVDGLLIGFVICEVGKDAIHVLNLAVSPGYRRQGFGSRLLWAGIEKLSTRQAFSGVIATICESDHAVGFYAARGFRARAVTRDAYDRGGVSRDAITMIYDFGRRAAVDATPLAVINR